MQEDVVIAAAARTPFGRFGGALRSLSIPQLAEISASAALERANVRPDEVDEVVLGVNLPGSDRSIARQALLRAGIPDDRPAITLDRACCAGITALSMARRSILLEEADVVLAGGAENMSRVPYFLEDMRWGHRLGEVKLVDQLVISCPHTGVPRAVQAADEALEYGVSRAEQDEWAARSHQRWAQAAERDFFAHEIVPVELPPTADDDQLTIDESPRPRTTVERLARLPTVYGSETVTAGNAPGLSTGSASAVLMTASEARRRGVTPLATVLGTAMVAGHPQKIASIPAQAARKALARAGVALEDVHRIEINEAFAAVPLVATLALTDRDLAMARALRERVNVNGGSIAIGHPTGATGTRLAMTAAYELRARGGGHALVAICGGIGEGEAIVLRVDEAS